MADNSASPKWKRFEEAVAGFVQALGPDAKVTHNVKVPDRDTGTPRQIDVWVEAKFGGHFPFKIHVSCKDWSQRLSIDDVDHFNSELRSSGAHVGVIYSLNGFSDNAIEKAKALGISCCRLFENQPADLPDSLVFHSYCFTPRMRLELVEPASAEWAGSKWSDVFALPTNIPDGPETVVDYLVECYAEHDVSGERMKKTRKVFPTAWAVEFKISFSEDDVKSTLWIRFGGSWRIYRGDVEAVLASGSYNITDENFVGSLASPWVDTQGPNPGPHWTEVESPPDSVPPMFCGMYLQCDPLKALQEHFADKPLPIAE
ncbi:MAG: hypothetical protein Tsb009_33810 [Planctomycetaceae bacterium]